MMNSNEIKIDILLIDGSKYSVETFGYFVNLIIYCLFQ